MADISKINVNSTTYNLKDSRIPNLPGTASSYLRGDGAWASPTVSTMSSDSDVSDRSTYLLITPTGGGSTVNLQAKTGISPSTSSQTITADAGFDGLSSVQINPMPSGSSSTPATSITATPALSLNSSTGVVTASVSASKSVTPSVSAGYISSGTAGTVSVSGSDTLQLTTQAAAVITPTKSSQTAVAAGKYTLGAVTVAAIPAQYITTTDATATASDILNGATAYVNGKKVTGNVVVQHYYTGSGTPSSSTGVNGDIYLQT